ncbi:hypothetical protein O9929_14785 [Vibrio lentus]|nr:hypothetical protein [Vibrio lentus]
MLGSAWLVLAIKNITSHIETITQQATFNAPIFHAYHPFLDINRSSIPYLSASYIDELEPLKQVVVNNISIINA